MKDISYISSGGPLAFVFGGRVLGTVCLKKFGEFSYERIQNASNACPPNAKMLACRILDVSSEFRLLKF